VSLTFIVGTAADVFAGELASRVGQALEERFPGADAAGEEPYRSEPVTAAGWPQLQKRAAAALGREAVPQLTSIEAYQAVYITEDTDVQHVAIPTAADPLQIGSVPRLLAELHRFAAGASLPTGDLELMQLAVKYLEDDESYEQDLDVQTYIQLMLSARQATARRQSLWVVT
jgi:hypothetical protein